MLTIEQVQTQTTAQPGTVWQASDQPGRDRVDTGQPDADGAQVLFGAGELLRLYSGLGLQPFFWLRVRGLEFFAV
jgi:hypothetical protein